MIKKYIVILFIFFSYSTMAIPSYAKEVPSKKNSEVEGIDSNGETKQHNDEENSEIPEVPDKQKEVEKIDSDLTCTKDIPFTPAQKKRLDQIYQRIYMDYVSLIETYAWSGALTQDQKILRYKMLKNYILTFQKRNYKWCSEHEEDEWEEEWYNSDND
jgi:hypothetical protein